MSAKHSKLAAALLLAAPLMLAAPLAQAQPSQTRSLQGGDNRVWTQHPHMHAMWEHLRAACAQGCAKADAAAFQKTAIADARALAPTVGMTPDQMAEHVKAIPGQLLKIGQEDPSILQDYDKFIVAVFGPA